MNLELFDADYDRVTHRCIELLVTPLPAQDRSAADIAFAAPVAIIDDAVWRYSSLANLSLSRAIIRELGVQGQVALRTGN